MNSFLRILFLVYFISHIPITICVDLQGIFGAHYPEQLQALLMWYVTTHKDFLMAAPPVWFQSILWIECLCQLPFFFVAVYALLFRRNWIRIPAVIYGAHVSTTLVPILGLINYIVYDAMCSLMRFSFSIAGEFYASAELTVTQRNVLCCFYGPYLIIPMILMVYMALNPMPFTDSDTGKQTKES